MHNLDCVRAAVGNLEGAEIVGVRKRTLSGKDRKVLELKLPTFRMPIYIDVKTGEVFNDNFGGRWGNMKTYDKFLQLYAAEVAKDFAQKNNYNYEEQALEDGQIRCTLTPKQQENYAGAGGYTVG